MSDHTLYDGFDEQVDDTPFEQTTDGNYPVVAPAEDMVPENITLTVDGVTYCLDGYVGKDITSSVHPDVLVYRTCTVVDGDEQ